MKKFMFLSILAAFVLWYLPMAPNPDMSLIPKATTPEVVKILVKYIFYNYRLLVGFVCVVLIAISSIKEIRNFQKTYQAIIYNQLENIMDYCFGNKQSRVRITIFKRAQWFEAFRKYMYHAYIKSRMETPFCSRGFKVKLKNIPIPRSPYLTIVTRIGTPNEFDYSTMFRIIEDDKGVEGVVGLAWNNKNPGKIILPDINSIENFEKYKKLDDIEKPDEKNMVQDYMKKGNVSFDKLKFIGRHSLGIWARLIHEPSNKKWGVIVIDSIDKDTIDKLDRAKINRFTREIRKIIYRNSQTI